MPLSIASNSNFKPFIDPVLADDPSLNEGIVQRYNTPEPIAHTALIAEGGGQRGIFTAGVLDSWLESGYNPFELLIGTSAGAQNLSSYLTGQVGFAQASIAHLSKQSQFFNIKRGLKGANTVDLDWYFDQVSDAQFRLNTEYGLTKLESRNLLISTTNSSSYRAEFSTPNATNWLTLLKASSALPYLYRKGVKIEGDYHVDGGLSAPLPVEEAYKRGARKIVVIRTMPKEYTAHTPWVNRLKSWICSSNRCPKALDYFVHHEAAYKHSLQFIASPPDDVEVVQIFPESRLTSHILGSADAQLEHDYLMGKRAGLGFIEDNPALDLSPAHSLHFQDSLARSNTRVKRVHYC
ncbi:patatin-like phospholipase family protein [Shewanella violacea]|uniref:Patatin-like phospholipase family n=1 Tax=Shewanella violacea (strain JCM 10179 / CIP 106290 / LMG 19151 / DSS12) TaxID=637905 RepID=D4ZJ52_SHEVD|nr:patatin family protein [Shewanella violacea]BAJ01701.1 Patatin-like phospholipase family [Shewanella violacea DSS12]